MKTITLSFLAFIIACLIGAELFAIDLIYRDEKGVSHYNCINACGPVKVRKSGKCEYLVQSIYFSGKVKACYPEWAGLQACGEIELEPVKPLREGLVNSACQ